MDYTINLLSPKSKPSSRTYIFTELIALFLTILSFQRGFNAAVASWVECGILKKMERDITTSKDFRAHFEFWAPQQLLRNEETLTMGHAVPAFIIFGFGLLCASVAFVVEFVHQHRREKIATKTRKITVVAWKP